MTVIRRPRTTHDVPSAVEPAGRCPPPTSPPVPTSFIPRRNRVRRVESTLASRHLGRAVRLTALLPPGYRANLLTRYPLLVLHDGQDFEALRLERRLGLAYGRGTVTPRVIVGVHADERRMREYATSGQPDYAGRGDLADAHRRFVVEELLPHLQHKYRLRRSRDYRALAGFSLGGLSAFDIAWHHEDLFGAVGCFSASFWWRSREFDAADPDADRIVVDRIRLASRMPQLRYYFVVGTEEETSDRNDNGIIDAIDDTLDVIAALRERGVPGRDVAYRLVEGGKHDQASWGPALVAWLEELTRAEWGRGG